MPSQSNLSLRLTAGRHEAVSSPDVPPRLGLLGGFALETEGGDVHVPVHLQRLLAFLALQGRPLHRAYVAGRLWFELDQERAQACLRTTLWRAGLVGLPMLKVTSTHLALDPSVGVDARELELCLERVLGNDAAPRRDDVDRLTQAGELLPDWYEDWVLQERERLRQVRLLALEAATDSLLAARRHSEAALAALAAIRADPLRESAYRLLIRSYLADGNVAEALRQFTVFRTELGRELGLEPSPQMRELLGGIG